MKVGSYEAKTRLPDLRVEAGETVTITRHGKPVAQLVPVEEKREMTVGEAIEGLRNFPRVRLGMPIRKAIEWGRRR
jgi:prevent-host-death family protein